MPDRDDPRTAVILAAAYEVHNSLGPGFEEVFYQRALAREFAARDLDFAREVDIPVFYKGEKLGTKRVDFLVGEVMVEIKACSAFTPEHFVQALSYLRATGFKTGLLLNFGAARVEVKRLANG